MVLCVARVLALLRVGPATHLLQFLFNFYGNDFLPFWTKTMKYLN